MDPHQEALTGVKKRMDFHQFVTLRLQKFVATPRMWGSEEAIEAMSLQLLEMEVLHYWPAALEKEPRLVLEAYTSEMSRRYGTGILPLHAITPKPYGFEQTLFDIIHKVRTEIRAKLLDLPAEPVGVTLPG